MPEPPGYSASLWTYGDDARLGQVFVNLRWALSPARQRVVVGYEVPEVISRAAPHSCWSWRSSAGGLNLTVINCRPRASGRAGGRQQQREPDDGQVLHEARS